ncbi:orc1/cdc6 family replication initiation protein [Halobium salinum]|uniref:ORC1-type DNA replication protein n=1 Tax=Halobium salinum TaxID=1364940 RepID=A0ABD5PA16_9EURY|nr:orc1/cdc6 family replication initiation protein [Halobium salinum]
MSAFEFTPGDFPFENRNALLDDYTPDELVGRDEELQQYHAALQPAIDGSQPDNIFLYGKTGVGKTAATRFLLDRLTEGGQQHDVDIETRIFNCDGLDTSYQIGVEIVNSLLDDGEKISDTGHPRSKVYSKMWDAIESLEGLLILVFDEVDHLQDDSLLYQLSRARENDNLEKSRVSVIGISNDLAYRDDLSPKVRSSLCERSINFSAYDAGELKQVLQQRQSIAFQNDVLESGVVPLCAAYGARESGDARKALDLLLKAGDVAQEDATDVVATDHVERGRDLLEREEVTRGILGLNSHEKILLYAIATFDAAGQGEVRVRDLYPRYERFSELADRDPLTSRWMHNHLDDLDMLGLVVVEKRNEGSSGGHYKTIALNQDLEPVINALNETIEEVGIHETIRQWVSD